MVQTTCLAKYISHASRDSNSSDFCCNLFLILIMYQSNRSLNIPPGHLNFWKIFAQIPPSRSRKAVQMPKLRYSTIPGDQMPQPPGNFSVASLLCSGSCVCIKTWFNRQHSYMPKAIKMVLEYLQIQSKACASTGQPDVVCDLHT